MPTNAEDIARCALSHYHNVLPKNKGKPQAGREWTVYAAIVASFERPPSGDERADEKTLLWVVSCATGSKCTSVAPAAASLPSASVVSGGGCRGSSGGEQLPLGDERRGMVLHDSHAEVLARRGLLRVLWMEVDRLLTNLAEATRGDAKIAKSTSKTSTFGSDASRRTTGATCENLAVEKTDQPKEAAAEPHRLLEIQHEYETGDLTVDGKSSDRRGSVTFKLREGLCLHLYISDSPCGDASIYEIRSECQPMAHGRPGQICLNECNSVGNLAKAERHEFSTLAFTGAKVVVSQETGVSADDCGGADQVLRFGVSEKIEAEETPKQRKRSDDDCGTSKDIRHRKGERKGSAVDQVHGGTATVAREQNQLLGALRTKSGRSNLPDHLRSASLSCSDKIVRWSVLGLQGALLSYFIPLPITFTSICVSNDPRTAAPIEGQRIALERAISNRTRLVLDSLCVQYSVPGKLLDEKNVSANSASYVPRRSDLRHFVAALVNRAPTTVHVVQEAFEQGKAYTEEKDAAHATLGKRCFLSLKGSASAVAERNSNGKGNDAASRKRKTTAEEVLTKKKQRRQGYRRHSPAGISLNWQRTTQWARTISVANCARERKRGSIERELFLGTELTVGVKGTRQGKRPRTPEDARKCASRLSRWHLIRHAIRCKQLLCLIEAKDLPLQGPNTNSDSSYNLPAKQSLMEAKMHPSLMQIGSETPFKASTRNIGALHKGNAADCLEGSGNKYQEIKEYLSPTYMEIRNTVLKGKSGALVGWLTSENVGNFTF